ncbi:MAG: ABC transporter permease [Chthoniobacteraceae bacterium]
MKKLLGIFGLFVFIFVATALLSPNFLGAYNLQNLVGWISLFGIISIGAMFVIVTGGIDLSIGSTIGLVGSLLSWMLMQKGWSEPVALLAVLAVSLCIGLVHGLLITKLRLQPFIVTLCGLLVYRGLARHILHDETGGFGSAHDSLRRIAIGKLHIAEGFSIPVSVFFLVGIAVVAAIFLNRTIWGRYLFALGRNETAARYSGINTDRMKILAYVACSLLGGVGGILFSLNLNSIQPSGLGEFYELYAIAGAVLGGCSLRGGEGSVLGVIIGTVILAGVIADELVKRYAIRRRAAKSLAGGQG